MQYPPPPKSQKTPKPLTIPFLPYTITPTSIPSLIKNNSIKQNKHLKPVPHHLKLKKSRSFCQADSNNEFLTPEALYDQNIKLKTEMHKIKRELTLVKSDIIKKENELNKNLLTYNNNNLLLNDCYNMNNNNECKHVNLIIKMKKQFTQVKKELEDKQEEIYVLKRNLKNSKLNELLIENSTLYNELEKMKEINKKLKQEIDELKIKNKHCVQLEENTNKQHFTILALQDNIQHIAKEKEDLNEQNVKLKLKIKQHGLNKLTQMNKVLKEKEDMIKELKSQIALLLSEKNELKKNTDQQKQTQSNNNNSSNMNTFSNKISKLNKYQIAPVKIQPKKESQNEHNNTNNKSSDNNKSNESQSIELENQPQSNKQSPSSLDETRQLTEITYILIKNFEANKITPELAMSEIFQPILDTLEQDSTIEKNYLITLLTSHILSLIHCVNPVSSDQNKISFFLSHLLTNSSNEFGEFMDTFMKIFENIKQYTKEIENSLLPKLKQDLLSHNKYLIENYKSEFISFCAFRTLLNKQKIVLDDTSAEFLIYKMKQFTHDNNSIFDLSYRNLINIIDEQFKLNLVYDELNDEIVMNTKQYEKILKETTLKIAIQTTSIKNTLKNKSPSLIVNNNLVEVQAFHKFLNNQLNIDLSNIEIYCLFSKYKLIKENAKQNLDNKESNVNYIDIDKLDKDLEKFKDESINNNNTIKNQDNIKKGLTIDISESIKGEDNDNTLYHLTNTNQGKQFQNDFNSNYSNFQIQLDDQVNYDPTQSNVHQVDSP